MLNNTHNTTSNYMDGKPPTKRALSKRPLEGEEKSKQTGYSGEPTFKKVRTLDTFLKPKAKETEDKDSEGSLPYAKISENGPEIIDKNDLQLEVFKGFIKNGREFMKFLLEELPWYRVVYKKRGFQVSTPRYTTVFGKDETNLPDEAYIFKPRQIPPILMDLKRHVEEATKENYNFCLVNFYSDGKDSISYHSDSEDFLGPKPCVASLSLGASRDFFLRHRKYRENQLAVEKFVVSNGDMIVMKGTTQHEWEHSIPKRAKAEGRINITFRKAINSKGTNNYYTYNVGTGPKYTWRNGQMVCDQPESSKKPEVEGGVPQDDGEPN